MSEYTHPTGEHIDWSAWPEPSENDGDGSAFGETALPDGTPGAPPDASITSAQR